MPDEGSMPKFKNHNRSIKVSFVVYANFEACTEAISGCKPRSDYSSTNKYQRHKTCGFCYQIVCFDDKLYSQEPVIYRANSESEDVAQIFVEILEENIKNANKKFDFARTMIFTDEDRCEFKAATYCWICKRSFDIAKDKVRDHCHFTATYNSRSQSSFL